MTQQGSLLLVLVALLAYSGASMADTQLTITIKYPNSNIPSSATMALRGSACNLSWSTSTAVNYTATDTWTTTVSCPPLGSNNPLQVKALLQDSQGDIVWQMGANTLIDVDSSPVSPTMGDGSGPQFTLYPWFFTVNGTYTTAVPNMFSPQFNNTRNVLVYTPPSYAENTYKPYTNVLLMHDGQNLFDPATSAFGVAWMCQDTINALVQEGAMEEVFIIGVWNTGANRINEYTYSYDASVGAGGDGDKYLDFLEETLLPQIGKLYPRADLSRDSLGILGSSLGGLISCYAGLARPKTYSIAGCMSSSFWWNNEDFLNAILAKYTTQVPDLTVYLDSGNAGPGKDDLTETIAVRNKMETQGYELNNTIWYYMQEGGQHGEKFWGERFWVPMTDLYPVRARTPTLSSTHAKVGSVESVAPVSARDEQEQAVHVRKARQTALHNDMPHPGSVRRP